MRAWASASLMASPCLVLLYVLLIESAAGQFIQDWTWRTNNGVEEPWWRPDESSQLRRIIVPDDTIFLEYNCQYLPAICQNARQFLISSRGSSRKWRTAFGADGGTSRHNKRRSSPEVCGAKGGQTWRQRHTCPEVAEPGNLAQPVVWRGSGPAGGRTVLPWPHTALEQGTTTNVIQHDVDSQGNTVYSNLRYTCDEWPAASWIEGGAGVSGDPPEGAGEPSYTRCAPHNCGGAGSQTDVKVKGEQNWQADAHNRLLGVANQIGLKMANYVRKDTPVLFFFRMTRQDNQIAARVVVERANGGETDQVVPGKRQLATKRTPLERIEWADSVSLRDLEAQSPGFHQTFIFTNGSVASTGSMPVVNGFGNFLDLDSMDSMYLDEDPDIEDNEDDVDEQGLTESTQLHDVPRLQERNIKSVHTKTARSATAGPLFANATDADLEKAKEVVEQAIAKSAQLNKARYANPARNHYKLKPGTATGASSGQNFRGQASGNDEETDPVAPPLLEITSEIAAAAALMAEADVSDQAPVVQNLTAREDGSLEDRASSFWMETIDRKGSVPWGDDDDYKVFRNVKDYGAVGDGKTDDTKAIKKAMEDGNRCGKKCNGSTLKNAIVYFPQGTYLVSSTITVYYGTQIIGDATDWPTLKAASLFIGLGVLSTDEYTGGGKGADGLDQEWYINTASFYRQIRNFNIDITDTRPVQEVAGIHYQVAQATSLQHVKITAKSGTTQRGIFSENGSGGVISDLTLVGGEYCFYGGNQQFTAQRITFEGCETAVQIIWDWGWVWKSITVKDVDVGFRLLPEDKKKDKRRASTRRAATGTGEASAGNIGSASFMDSSFSNVGTAVLIAPLNSKPGSNSTGVVLDNVSMDNVDKAVADTDGNTLLKGGGHIDQWVAGPVYSPSREYIKGKTVEGHRREGGLLDTAKGYDRAPYFERTKPQYENEPSSSFVHLKDLGCKGDGKTDDTQAFQNALNRYSGRIIFADAGTYILKHTVTIPAGTKLVGETWTQFAASGSYFKDASNPKVMIKVGNEGAVGDVELQDLLFTTDGATAGAILVQWNIKASSPGSAGLWDCHVRIGGATGTSLTPEECPPKTSGVNDGCQAASLMMHITPKASGYFENMWLWVADHMIDDPLLDDADNEMVQTSIYVARGFLIESQASTWLYGTSSEHAVYYQYNFNYARHIFAGMIQSESPYYQPEPKPPAPFDKAVGVISGDPAYDCDKDDKFNGCDQSWAVIIRGCNDMFVAGAGLYSWFSVYEQDCIDDHECQRVLLWLKNNGENLRLQHLITIGAEYMLVQDGKGILATDNLNVKDHPAWSQISIFDPSGSSDSGSHVSPEDATIIPLSHTTVPAKSTLTVNQGVSTDIVRLPNDGDQNEPEGPGADQCSSCCFFRLITSTCCGTGGSIGNPILLPKGVPAPVPIELPAGFKPNIDFVAEDGTEYEADKAISRDATIPIGTVFKSDFIIPAGQPLCPDEDGNRGDLIWIDPKIWDDDHPTVWCQPPCTLQLPPWEKATSTIDYPIVTVSDGTWTTTITRKPITVTEWVFETLIVTTNERATTTTTDVIIVAWPTFATTTTWPPVTYKDDDDDETSTRPPSTNTHPGPPPPPGPSPPPPPPHGSWPTNPVTISIGPPKPRVPPCAFPAFQCPGSGGDPDGPGGGEDPDNDDEDDDDEDDNDELGFCLPDEGGGDDDGGGDDNDDGGGDDDDDPDYDHGNPSKNEVSCFGKGYYTSHEMADKAIKQFCEEIEDHAPLRDGDKYEHEISERDNTGQYTTFAMRLVVSKGCEWKYSYDECKRYMLVPIDSCDCNSVDNKYGGTVSNNCLDWKIDSNFPG